MSTFRLTGLKGDLNAYSTFRLTAVAGATTPAATFRLTELSGVSSQGFGIDITGPTAQVEAFDLVTLTANVTGVDTPSSYTWSQIAGPTVTLSPSGATCTFEAPALDVTSHITIQVVAQPGNVVDTYDIDVFSATWYILFPDGLWRPTHKIILG